MLLEKPLQPPAESSPYPAFRGTGRPYPSKTESSSLVYAVSAKICLLAVAAIRHLPVREGEEGGGVSPIQQVPIKVAKSSN